MNDQKNGYDNLPPPLKTLCDKLGEIGWSIVVQEGVRLSTSYDDKQIIFSRMEK